jgi:hypothetical protein
VLRAFVHGVLRQATDWNTFALLGAIVIFALAPGDHAARLLLVAIGGLTAVTALAWPGDSVGADFAPKAVWILRSFIEFVWGWLFAPTVLLLVLSFPRQVWPLTCWPRRTIVLIYGLPLLTVAVAFNNTNTIFFHSALGLLGIYALLIVISTIVITAHTFRRVHNPILRAQTAWLTLGLTVGLAFWPLLWILSLIFPDLLTDLNKLP